MLGMIRKLLPEHIKKYLRLARDNFYDPIYKRILVRKMSIKHQALLGRLQNKDQIRVVFLVYTTSIWKLDTLFQTMLDDPQFDPIIFVYADMTVDNATIFSNIQYVYHYFKKIGYPVVSSYHKDENRWIGLDEISTDIVFFSDQSARPLDEYYRNAYLHYLSCFCGYGYIVTNAPQKNIENYNLYFHNALWRNYITDPQTFVNFQKLSATKGKNTLLTGFPNIERLLNPKSDKTGWRFEDQRLKIIYAPHHSIEDGREYKLANFNQFANFMKELVVKYRDQVVWCFKPHPALKEKLGQHPLWGKEEADNYYKFWEEQENTQYLDGDYVDLFKNSDAMIHDSGSFLVEYLTQKKPVLYLVSENIEQTMSDLAKRALKSCQQAGDELAIEEFILKLLQNENGITKEHERFYEEEFVALYSTDQPSDRIIRDLKSQIFNGRENS